MTLIHLIYLIFRNASEKRGPQRARRAEKNFEFSVDSCVYICYNIYWGGILSAHNEALYAFAYLRMRHAPTPVGGGVPGAPLRCHSRRRCLVAERWVYRPPVGGGVLDAPSVGRRETLVLSCPPRQHIVCDDTLGGKFRTRPTRVVGAGVPARPCVPVCENVGYINHPSSPPFLASRREGG